MNKYRTIFKTLSVVSCTLIPRFNSHICNIPAYEYLISRRMAQKSIMSFFKKTPNKSTEDHQEKLVKDDSFTADEAASKESPVSNARKMRSSKRLRSDSDEPASPSESKKSPSQSTADKIKKIKRQRIESSESESDSGTKDTELSGNDNKCETNVKIEKNTLRTYQSPRNKKANGKHQVIKKEPTSPETKENIANISCTESKVITPENMETKGILSKRQVKDEELSPTGTVNTANGTGASTSSPTQDERKQKSPKKRNVFEVLKGKACKKGVEAKVPNGDNVQEVVAEVDYNPSKSRYHPIEDACWGKGQAVPYLALARTLEAIEGTSARLRMVEILSNYLRSVIALTPEDLLPSIYLCLNQLAPAYHSIELGIAETYLMKAVGQCTGRTLAQMKAAAQKSGDLGLVAEQARATQRTMFAPPPLTVRKVFNALKEVALMTGQASVNKKIGKIQSLYVACRHSEARYLIRSLEGKLRVGLAEQSLLQALALATASDPPGEAPAVSEAGDKLKVRLRDLPEVTLRRLEKARMDRFALIIKTTYCECPNYELIVPVLLQNGVEALPDHCRLTPGIPLKPMLAHPTKGVLEVFNRFEKEEFTCEYKYDGERAQLHVPAAADGAAPDLRRAAVFSRNQEDNTSKYPDILSRLPALLGEGVISCVLDCEAVAYDPATEQILPFQVLSTRKRKDASETTISVQVCVFVFDLLFLNGRALVREPLAERRRLLREHLRETEGVWQFATSRDCTTTEEVQQFLDEAVRGSCEGLMVKTLRGDHARYDIARRSRNWLKLKKDYLDGVGDTIDVVVIGGYWGRGKRSGVFGGFLLACHDPATEEYQSLCKIGTGFSDDDLKSLSETLQRHVIDSPPNYYRYDSSHAPDVWFAAANVWEVRCADLSLSPAHRAAAGLAHRDKGVSLRFPRFIRVREDKAPEQATSAHQIAEMYLAQDQVRNLGAKPLAEDDFY